MNTKEKYPDPLSTILPGSNMRSEVERLVKLGVFPSESNPDAKKIQLIQETLSAIQSPVTNQEAEELVKLFGRDSCFGLVWTLIHLVETAPDWPIERCLTPDASNPWIICLRKRARLE